MTQPQTHRYVSLALLCTAIVTTAAVRCMPMFSSSALQRAEHTYVAEDGHRYPFLLERDSYSWLRKARNQVEKGTPCEAIIDGRCWDTLTLAPHGDVMPYADSLHIRGIAWLHRALRVVRSDQPLELSAFFLQVILGTLAVIPAWLLGLRLGGPWGAWASTLLVGLHPMLLFRTVGADNDVWSLTLTLLAAWAVVEGLTRSALRQRVAFAVVAGVALGLHARAWRGWLFAAAFLGCAIALCALWTLVRGWVLRDSARALAELKGWAWFSLALSVSVIFVVGPEQVTAMLAEQLPQSRAAGSGAPMPFPSALRHVSEAKALPHERILELLGGLRLAGALVGVAWLASAWASLRVVETIVLGLAAAASVGALLWSDASALTIAKVTLIPVGLVLSWRMLDRRSQEWSPPAALLVLVAWLAVTLRMSDGPGRFVSLAAVPLGLALGAGAGSLVQHIGAGVRDRAVPWVLAGALALAVLHVSREGVVLARDVRPPLTTTWYGALAQLERSSPKDAIVHALWGYGYWIQYFAHRAVTADGASLLKRVPHWTSRALMTEDPREALGIFRMLSCDSDFTDAVGRDHGAIEVATRAVQNQFAGLDLVLALAKMGPKQAAAHVAAQGLESSTSTALLASTHCAPRPSYLMLSDEQAFHTDLRYQGHWDHRRAFVASNVRSWSQPKLLAAMRDRLRMTETAAQEMYARAQGLRGEKARDQFISRALPGVYVPRCRTDDDVRVCTILPGPGHPPSTYGVLRIPVREPLRAEFASLASGQKRAASTVVLASGGEVTTHVLDPSAVGELDDYAVLIDQASDRVVVGSSGFVRSVFSRLMFLPGYPLPGFERVDERSGERERVMTFRLQFPAE